MSTGSPLRRIAVKLGAAIGMHPGEVLERLMVAIERQKQVKAQWESIGRQIMAEQRMTQVLQLTEKSEVIHFLAMAYDRSEEEVERRVHKGLERGSVAILDAAGIALNQDEVQILHDQYRGIWISLKDRIEGKRL